jgi:hypothetical protein
MTQTSFDDWHERKNVKKGDIGEQIVIDYLANKGYVVYKSITQGTHPFDNLCASRDKKKIFIAEVKTKEARKYYPDTGINIKSYDEYKFIQDKYNLRVYLFFVDATNKKVYGNLLQELETEVVVGKYTYPLRQKGIIYFSLSNMKTIAELTEEQSNTIKEFNTKNYEGAWSY